MERDLLSPAVMAAALPGGILMFPVILAIVVSGSQHLCVQLSTSHPTTYGAAVKQNARCRHHLPRTAHQCALMLVCFYLEKGNFFRDKVEKNASFGYTLKHKQYS